jgi:ring-1,2-phenylacetyl-CoA epoxidase subunit PaaE
MGIFDIFKKKEFKPKGSKGFHEVKISLTRLTKESVQVTFEIPSELKHTFEFIPGQYINVEVFLNGKNQRRSYSICSGKNEALSIAVKAIDKGLVSNWFKAEAKNGDIIHISKPEGGFHLSEGQKNVVAIAAGSGITPILSIAKGLESDGKMTLFYGNQTSDRAIFLAELNALSCVIPTYYLSQETKEGFKNGRIDKENFTSEIKQNLELLKADSFFICGPEEMIHSTKEVLKFFGVQDSKIKFELFTTPTAIPVTKKEMNFKGKSHIKVLLDHEVTTFDMQVPGGTILEQVERSGLDVPYSCRGGVCSSCKAKVLEGDVVMKLNYSLTDEEVANGYVLTCQAIPQSEIVSLSYDV